MLSKKWTHLKIVPILVVALELVNSYWIWHLTALQGWSYD